MLEFGEDFFDEAEGIAGGGADAGRFLAWFLGFLTLGGDRLAGFGGDESEADGDGEFGLGD